LRVYNGVAVRNRKLTAPDDHYPQHKQQLIETMYRYVNPDDEVITIGGGNGVLETHVARHTGSVITYEAAREMVDVINETARLNRVAIDVRHAIVGNVYEAYGTVDDATTVQADELSANVAILDCEGAETDILPLPQFDTVIVETHPEFGAGTKDIVDKLDGETSVVGPDEINGDVVVR